MDLVIPSFDGLISDALGQSFTLTVRELLDLDQVPLVRQHEREPHDGGEALKGMHRVESVGESGPVTAQ
jgi:hypothetical protein